MTNTIITETTVIIERTADDDIISQKERHYIFFNRNNKCIISIFICSDTNGNNCITIENNTNDEDYERLLYKCEHIETQTNYTWLVEMMTEQFTGLDKITKKDIEHLEACVNSSCDYDSVGNVKFILKDSCLLSK